MNNGSNSYIKEACVESIIQALRAEELGADQIEYCARLDVDGLTPPIGDVKFLLSELSIPIKVMIRPREGDFNYSSKEFKLLLQQVNQFMEIGITHFVTGMLDDDLQIDEAGLSAMCNTFQTASFCFHKAIDSTPNLLKSLNTLNPYHQFTEVLSSGKEKTAWLGRNTLKQMMANCADHLNLIIAGKVTNKNIEILHQEIGAQYYHGRKIVGDLGI